MARVVGHIDLDYFYAQVEEVEEPNLKSVPLVVCVFSGRTENSGVVSTANYRARELGVRSGIPIAIAKSRLKDTNARFVPINRAKYEEYSNQVMEMVRDCVDVLEQTGIDEAFFDITRKSGGDYGAASEIAKKIKETILVRERLTCSIGIAPSKVVAKLASDFKKPDGLTVVRPENVQAFAWPMLAEKLYGVGPKSSKILKDIGVTTIGDLATKDPDVLNGVFDRRFSVYLHNASNGLDDEPVVTTGEAKQLSRIITLKKDSLDAGEVFGQLSPAIDDLHRKILEKGVFFRSVSIIGILTDLSIRTRTKTMDAPNKELATLRKAANELLISLLGEGQELRRVGIRVSDLSEAKAQSSLSEFVG